MMQKSHH
jgi:hypothetical protein